MEKYYIVNEEVKNVEKGDIIRFNMPPFCSGEYLALVEEDEKGLYIDKKNQGYFEGSRGDVQVIKPAFKHYNTFAELL